MASPSEELEFASEDRAGVLERMTRLGTGHRGWMNLQPGVREEDAPEPPGAIAALFGAVNREVPLCTWVAGRRGRQELEPDTIGVQHGVGARVLRRLAGDDVALPAEWRLVQDHPRRGLVVRPPVGTGYAEQLDWLLRAGKALCAVPLTGDWLASVYEGR